MKGPILFLLPLFLPPFRWKFWLPFSHVRCSRNFVSPVGKSPLRCHPRPPLVTPRSPPIFFRSLYHKAGKIFTHFCHLLAKILVVIRIQLLAFPGNTLHSFFAPISGEATVRGGVLASLIYTCYYYYNYIYTCYYYYNYILTNILISYY